MILIGHHIVNNNTYNNQQLGNTVDHAVKLDQILWYAIFDGVVCVPLMFDNDLKFGISDIDYTDILNSSISTNVQQTNRAIGSHNTLPYAQKTIVNLV